MGSEIISAVTCIAQFTVTPIVKQVKYVFNYKENMTKLPREVEKLMDLKQEIKNLVSSALRNAEDVKASVETWMKEADQAAEAARQIIREEEEQSKLRCFIGQCSNPVSRHRSSRKAFKETVQILQVQAAGREFKEVSVSISVPVVSSFAGESFLGKDFLDFSSRSKTLEDITKALTDREVNVIGVYGMGGLGKTTLVKQVAARAAKEKLFDEVVMPVVTQKNVLGGKEFQDELAKVWGMRLDDQWNVSRRAAQIFKRLTQKTIEKTEKKIIVILDDLRAKLDLKQVGIPFGDGIKGCKILFTSRFLYVSYAAQKEVTLGVLGEEEAWRLFQKTVGDALEDPAFFNVGEEVTRYCKGLPILIVTVAGALLHRRSLGAWKDALINLQREGSKEMKEFVDSALEFISFNHLSPDNKKFFLLCGLVGGGETHIDNLLNLGICWGLFEHTRTVEEVRNSLETLIIDLKASFLLLEGRFVHTVRMHDVVRDVATKIASKHDHNMLLLRSSDEWPEDDMLKRCTALTFPYGTIPDLPECLESPSLEFLLLHHDSSPLKIRDNTFEKLQQLTVLDMDSIDLSPALPSSLSLLQNLKTLSLNSCKLGDISVVGALRKLKILSLSNADIKKLPMEIGNLSELRILDVYGCSELQVPRGIIQRLSKLEELDMTFSFAQWEYSQGSNASLDELNFLPNLSTLRLHIPDAKLIPETFSFKKLERFTILIGDEEWDWECHDDCSLYIFRGIKIKFNSSRNIHLEAGVQEMLKKIEILYLDGMKNIHELEWKSFHDLKFVHIQHSVETRYIVNTNTMGQQTQDRAFPAALESLFLRHLNQLQNICIGRFMAGSSFSKLKIVNVNNCHNLRNLFSFSMARKGIPHLEEVEVSDCEALESIFEDTGEDDKNGNTVIGKLEFHRLRSLILKRLPKLASFCNNVKNPTIVQKRDVMEADELGSEEGCTTAMPFFSDKVLFHKLEQLILEGCGSVEYLLFTHSIAMGLEQVKGITIKGCTSLKEIVAQLDGEETNEKIKLPRLDRLVLNMLPRLTRVCSGSSIAFPTLEYLKIEMCRQLETFVGPNRVRDTNEKLGTAMQSQPLFNEKVEFPKLKKLILTDLGNVKTIWHNQLHEDSFFKLEDVTIQSCPNLLKIFPSTMLTRIQSLKTLNLRDNGLVEEVFENDEMMKPNISRGGEATEDDRIEFSQLRHLNLPYMSNLKQFCSGGSVVFSALTELRIVGCEQFETLVHPIAVNDSRSEGVEDVDSNVNLIW